MDAYVRNQTVMVDWRRGATLAGMKPLLGDRLTEFAGRVCSLIRRSGRDPALETIHRQLGRSATSPAANYAEARGAATTRDYIYKMNVCVRELRETQTWLRIAARAGYHPGEVEELTQECGELIAISLTCARKAAAGKERNI